jgi:hypothetical protein
LKNNGETDMLRLSNKPKTIKNRHSKPIKIPTFDLTSTNKENPASLLDELTEMEQQLLIEKKQIISTLVKWQSMFDTVTDKKSRLLEHIKKEHSSKQKNSEKAKKQNDKSVEQHNSESLSSHKLFSVVTRGPSWDGLVFAVMAENDAWAQDLVRQWLDSNGRTDQEIDRVMALVSRDVRGIVNVGAKLLNA